ELFRRPPQRHQPAHPPVRGARDPVERDRAAVVHPRAGHALQARHLGSAADVCRVAVLPAQLAQARYRHAAGVPGAVGADLVAAWIAQFVGHKLEGRKPSFLTDLVYLLIGPAWVLSKLYRRLGWHW